GLPDDGTYNACHAYGPGFGSEAAAGMGLCPSAVNQPPGQMWNLEERLRNLYQRAAADGGWVELSVTSHSVASTALPAAERQRSRTGAMAMPSGHNLLSRVDYDATVCRAGQVVDNYRFGIMIGPPMIRDWTFFSSMSTVYGRPPP